MASNYDRWVTSEPNDGFDLFCDNIYNQLADLDELNIDLVYPFQNSDIEISWLNKLYQKPGPPSFWEEKREGDYELEDLAQIFLRAYKIYVELPTLKRIYVGPPDEFESWKYSLKVMSSFPPDQWECPSNSGGIDYYSIFSRLHQAGMCSMLKEPIIKAGRFRGFKVWFKYTLQDE
jgi:hypothetical protein